jgi:CO/xanthine dehydrogenase FAD-binding subunit
MEIDYVEPQSLEEAVSCLLKGNGIILAGGTDIVPQIKRGNFPLKIDLISVKNISDLKGIEERPEAIHIGALTTHAETAGSSIINKWLPALAQACGKVASTQIRNRGTIGGNVCNGTPCADSLAPLAALDAEVRVYGPDGYRNIPFEDFYLGPGKNSLSHGELVVSFEIPKPLPQTTSAYMKLSLRNDMDFAWLGMASVLTCHEKAICKDVKLVVSALYFKPRRLKSVEKYLKSQRLDKDVLDGLGAVCRQDVAAGKRAIDDRGWEVVEECQKCRLCRSCRVDLSYRREMVAVIARRTLDKALAQFDNAPTGGLL